MLVSNTFDTLLSFLKGKKSRTTWFLIYQKLGFADCPMRKNRRFCLMCFYGEFDPGSG
jgi:hypothetical protein